MGVDLSTLGGLSDTAALFGRGLVITLELLVVSTVLAMVLAVPLAVARLSANPFFRWPAFAYSAFFRGTPLLVQIFLFYYGLSQFPWIRQSIAWPFLRDAFPCAQVVLTLNMVAYVAEVVRGGIMAVPSGEKEAALSVGMGPFLMYRRIILPRAFRLMLPALSNEVAIQLKSTSLACTITLLDVTGVGRRLAAASYSTEPLIVAGVIYMILAFLIGRVFKLAEARLSFQRRA
ncbi:amino acid ABC transporter permease [Telmatospirillum siberiense]|uniref:Amino acid ABC transporter permease n=2 Tax=Telmatospirillum siberiense TaxID=382514 RepID=A0A2N3PVH6_9PROT|nr:amino acid ABC transporter permease [Telmatospirillum siberiense]